MGIEIDRVDFDAGDHERFTARLESSLEVLSELLARPGFGEGEASLGAELELCLVDEAGRPSPRNTEVLECSSDARLTFELDRFNLEANLRHGPLAGDPFARLAAECEDCLSEVERAAAACGAGVAMIGILPTLGAKELEGDDAMTRCLRYEALSRSLRALRDEPFWIDIHGEDHLRRSCEDVTYEGAATSFQVHLRVSPGRFADVYDAVQLATPALLAASGNSPLFLGRRLWHETRIALFKQAVDHRAERGAQGRPARVSFGSGWTRDPHALFAEAVEVHPPLLPVLDGEDPREALDAGRSPGLRELRLHQGTVWRWNRAIYDPAEGGHLRVEMRALPAGPTVADMVAGCAFHIGLALELAESADTWRGQVDFEVVHADFYRAAREGLDAQLHWPPALGGEESPRGARGLVEALLPRARAGLTAAGVDDDDARRALAPLERRVASGQTGAVWQLQGLARLEATRTRDEAIARLLAEYRERSRSGEPVADWGAAG